MSYSRLTFRDRVRISRLRKQGKNQSEIARNLGVHRSTISREVRRNKHQRWYSSLRAHNYAKARQRVRRYCYKLTPVVISLIEERLQFKWSPEQIFWSLKLEGQAIVSIESIYKYIYINKSAGGSLWQNLRRSHKTRRRRIHSRVRGKLGDNPLAINERPAEVESRATIGHWERDTMSGINYQTGVLVLTERRTRFNKFVKLSGKKAKEVTIKTIRALKGLPIKSLTNDRGQEFSDHKRCASKLRIKIYFCDPYSSYQRGTNENRIGVLRQYLPKQFNPKAMTQSDLQQYEYEINNRPMKCLDWKTPHEVMMENLLH